MDKTILQRIVAQIRNFPSYAKIKRVTVSAESWSMDNILAHPHPKNQTRQSLRTKYNEAMQEMLGYAKSKGMLNK